MDIVRYSIENPVKIAVGVILIVLFGITTVFHIPIQLTPTVEQPVISVTTRWWGASPQEIEREIVNRQEDQLKNVSNLEKITSKSEESQAVVLLEFPVGTDKDVAFRDVSDKLRQVTEYPEEVDEPVVTATDNVMENIIAWMILSGKEDVAPLKTFIEDQVKPLLERAGGIAEVAVYGGRDREVKIVVDPHVLAARGLTFRDLELALQRQNRNVSAGTVSQGKLDYSFRAIGEFRTIAEIENTVVAFQSGGPVLIRDVAKVIDGLKKQYAFVRSKGEYVIAMAARKETGANVVAAIESLKEKIALANREVLGPKGMQLELTQVYDETAYIRSAIDLVIDNIWLGGLFTVLTLWLFLRNIGATAIIAVAIPISTVGTFLVIALLDRTLNIVMLAGLAFAVGMVVDNANVVLENIDRHRSMGKDRKTAALDGTREVWGAVLAGSLSAMVVFLPVIFVQEEVGQLFKDIAIAITAAVAFSLLVAVFVVPPLAARYMGASKQYEAGGEEVWRFGRWVGDIVDRVNHRTWRRFAVVVGLSSLSLWGSWLLMPPADYLPAGNKNLVFGLLVSPPGYSVDEFKRMAEVIEEGDRNDPHDGVRPAWEAKLGSPEAAQLPKVSMAAGGASGRIETITPPPMENFFFVAWNGVAFMGCTSRDPDNVAPLKVTMENALHRIPGVFSFFSQLSLFSTGGAGNSIEIEVRGEHYDDVVASTRAIAGSIMAGGYGYAIPNPSNYELGRPEVQLVPDREKAAHLGLDVRDVGFILESCIDGAFVGEYNDKGRRIDMVLVTGSEGLTQEAVGQIPIYTPSGHLVPIASAVELRRTTAPQQINHIEEMPAVTLQIHPKPGMPLQTIMDDLEKNIIARLRETGAVPPTVITSLAGTASKLKQTQHALLGNYQNTVVRPSVLGLSIAASMGLLLLVCLGATAAGGMIGGRRWAAATLCVGLGVLVAGFLVLNPAFLLTLCQSRLFLAVVVTYLMMAGLFESFSYPFVIMFSVPFGIVGGFAALAIVHYTSLQDVTAPDQQFDVLTMLGFVMLLGIVVNNAILLVHQAINFMKHDGMGPHEAVVHSVRTRTRPILMTTLTTLTGLIPLCVMTGAGSELYRGLGSVVLGGLTVSTIFTLVVVPAVFTLVVDLLLWLREPAATVFEKTAIAPSPAQVSPATVQQSPET